MFRFRWCSVHMKWPFKSLVVLRATKKINAVLLASRTVRTPTLLSVLWPFAQWAASGWTRSPSTSVSHWGSAWKMRTHMWGRRRPSVWLNFMTSTPKWWRTRASWTLSEISLLTQTPWWVLFSTWFPTMTLTETHPNSSYRVQSAHCRTPPSSRSWPTQWLRCLRSVSRTPTATCWTSIPKTSTSCWRPSTSAQSGDRSSSWTACPTTTPRMSVKLKGIRLMCGMQTCDCTQSLRHSSFFKSKTRYLC